ncbi:MAG: hypothetical protein Q8T03_08805 [Bacteroidota bacterium]|nr:hypothetical protein [Bacteroidota bacterium]
MKKLQNKTEITTRRLSGIGKEFVLKATKDSTTIYVAIIKSATKNKMEEIKKENPVAFFIECEAPLISQIQIAIEKVITNFRKFDTKNNISKTFLESLKTQPATKIVSWG